MSGEPLPLRPHHGMCMAYFVGRGYSEEFAAHMAAVLAALTPDAPVRLTTGVDAVCAACPNNLCGVCDTAEKVAAYDRAVLALCGLGEGCVLPFGRFTALVQRTILGPGLRPAVCGGCQWNALCAVQPSRWAAGSPIRPPDK